MYMKSTKNKPLVSGPAKIPKQSETTFKKLKIKIYSQY